MIPVDSLAYYEIACYGGIVGSIQINTPRYGIGTVNMDNLTEFLRFVKETHLVAYTLVKVNAIGGQT